MSRPKLIKTKKYLECWDQASLRLGDLLDVETETSQDWAKDVDTETPPRLSLISALFFSLNVYLGALGLSCELGWPPCGPRRWLFKYLFCYSRVPEYSLLSRVWITSGVLICARCHLMFPRKRYHPHPALLLLFLYHLTRFSPVTLWLSP